MRGEGQIYSRLIAGLKILLPLAALVLLSTIFLFSRGSSPVSQIPVFEDGFDPGAGQQIDGPFFAGATDSGHALTLEAGRAEMVGGTIDAIEASDIRAVLDTANDGRITLSARSGLLTQTDDRLSLEGGVSIESTAGYMLETQGLWAATTRVEMESTAPVSGEGPPGTFTAGKLRIEEEDEAGDIRLLFTNGIKLIYTPQTEGSLK